MNQDEFIKELKTYWEKLENEVISHFKKLDPERGDLAFDSWRNRFIAFLEDYTNDQSSKFVTATHNFRFIAGLRTRESPLDTFMRESGKKCFAFIGNLMDEVRNGYIEISPTELPKTIVEKTSPKSNMKRIDLNKTFVVHGQDNEAKLSVARFLDNLGLKPIILHEQTNAGKTLIEKFEHHSNDVDYAIVILTPDDVGSIKNNQENLQPRARQNVIFELGYFFAKLGRENVCALYKEGVEIPSDIYGVVYVLMDSTEAWKIKLAKEMKQAGLDVDMNKI